MLLHNTYYGRFQINIYQMILNILFLINLYLLFAYMFSLSLAICSRVIYTSVVPVIADKTTTTLLIIATLVIRKKKLKMVNFHHYLPISVNNLRLCLRFCIDDHPRQGQKVQRIKV